MFHHALKKNEAVARNIKRMPGDFKFCLTDEELKSCYSKMKEQVGEADVNHQMFSQKLE